MKKLDELVTSTEKPEQRAKKKAITFGSFKRAEEKQIAERKEREHQEELSLIAEQARIERELKEEEERVIREENKRKRSEFITGSLSNAFGTKTDIDYEPVREKVIDKYLPQLREQETLDDYPKPFESEPALNAELAEFKKKINEHLHKVGFMGSGGGGIGALRDAVDVDGSAQTDGKFLKFRASDSKFIGDDVAIDSLAISKLDIDGGTDIGAAIVDADLFIVDDGAGGTNRKVEASRIKTYAAYDGAITTLDIDGGTDVGADLVDADLVIVDDGAGGTNRKSELTRIKKYIFSALSGDATAGDSGALTIANTSIENGMLAGSIANSKLSNSSITVSDGSTTTAVSLGGTITFSATTNETTVSESSGTITIGLPNDVTIAGDLTVNGDTVTVNTATLSVEDPLIKLANGNNSADSVDVGFYGLYDTSGSQDLYAGLFRDANDSGKFKLFKDLQAEPTTTVNTSGTGYAVGTLVANIEGDVTGTLQTAAQTNITSLGTLTTLTVDNIIINGTNIGHTSDTDAIAIASNGIVNFSAGATIASNTIKTAGKETIYIPAAAMYPTTTSGCAALTQVEISSSQPELKVLDFDPSSDENAQFSVAFPKSWNEGVITFRAFFTVTGTNTGTVKWELSGVSMGDNDTIGASFGTAVGPTAKAHSGASNDINITAESGNITITNAAVDEMVFFNVQRDTDDDNQTGDARLIGIQIFFTTDATNDA